jgi:adenine-specific DNA methylase
MSPAKILCEQFNIDKSQSVPVHFSFVRDKHQVNTRFAGKGKIPFQVDRMGRKVFGVVELNPVHENAHHLVAGLFFRLLNQ